MISLIGFRSTRRSTQVSAETRLNTQVPAIKKANRSRLAFTNWWCGGSGRQTSYISGLGVVRTAAGSLGQGRYVVSSLPAMNRLIHEMGGSLVIKPPRLFPRFNYAYRNRTSVHFETSTYDRSPRNRS